MTVIRPNSISGITSLTALDGSIDFYKVDGQLAGLTLGGVNFNATSGVSTFSSLQVTDINASGVSTFSGNIVANTATFSGNISVAGTLTYEDVTNVDSVGLITARSGVVLTGGDITLGTGVTVSGASANTFTLSTNGGERLNVDSSGRLLVGTSSYSGNSSFVIKGGAAQNVGIVDVRYGGSRPTGADIQVSELRFGSTDFTANTAYASIACITDAASSSDADIPGRLVFATTADGVGSPTERMRITSGGGLKHSNTGSYPLIVAPEAHEITQTNASLAALHVYHTASSGTPYGIYFRFTQQNPNDASSYVFTALDNNTSNIYTIFSNGTVSARSDGRLKKNIETTRDGYLEDLSRLRVVKYNWLNHNDDTPKELGFIAQEVEEIFPGLVLTVPNKDSEGSETGDTTKSIKTSVFTPMLVKALQEALGRIETLEAEVAALKAQ